MSQENTPTSKPSRLASLDALRGFDMFWIAGGGEMVKAFIRLFSDPMPKAVEFQFEHVEWVGFAAWDLIMPLFLFLAGVSIPLAFSRRLEKGEGRKGIYAHVLRRIAILWVLGMIAQGHLLAFNLDKLHFYSNTLQAIASGYLIAVIVFLHLPFLGQCLVNVGLLALFWILMMTVPVPGFGAGVLTPDGNLAMYIDNLLLGRFRDGTPYTWILSSLTFGSTVLFGVLAGHMLRSKRTPKVITAQFLLLGVALVALGIITGQWFPIIKHIWTSSFTLYAAGLSFLLLALFYGVIDGLGWRAWAFGFTVIGANSIFTYMVGEFISAGSVKEWFFPNADFGHWAWFGLATAVFGLLWLLLYVMYKKKWFVRV